METLLSLLLAVSCAAGTVGAQERFLVSAPSVFHVGVSETVSVQLDPTASSRTVSLYLEDESSKTVVSEKAEIKLGEGNPIGTVSLKVLMEKVEDLKVYNLEVPYLLLVAEMNPGQRKVVRVLLSSRRGYIFIQTNQPVYTPRERVQFRVFTLDHAMRPVSRTVTVSVHNAAGSRVWVRNMTSMDGIVRDNIPIPDVSEPGLWKVTAHYRGAERNNVTREFEVKKFVLPSFEVTVKPDELFYHVKDKHRREFVFKVLAKYSYGELVEGTAHTRFAVADDRGEPVFIRGLELQSAVRGGEAEFRVNSSRLSELVRRPLAELTGARFYIAASVMERTSGELQEAELTVKFVDSVYSVDLSRTRRHYVPGVPFHVSALVSYPDGSPAARVPVLIRMSGSEDVVQEVTDEEGAVHHKFNIPGRGSLTVTVTVEGEDSGSQVTSHPTSSPSGSFLYLIVGSGVATANQGINIQFITPGGSPHGSMFYLLVVSRGQLRRAVSVPASQVTAFRLPLTSDLVPSFRLIGYYHTPGGDVIADSAWVDVQDECEGQISVTTSKSRYPPGSPASLLIRTEGSPGKVALLAVDTAMYALKRQNRLTARQVFSAMNSYDLGCSFGGGANMTAVFNDAGLSFIASKDSSQMRIGFSCKSGFRRQTRALNINQIMQSTVHSYSDPAVRRCCTHGFTLLPMRKTCEERAQRLAGRKELPRGCAGAFLRCCKEGHELRERKRREGSRRGVARTFREEEFEDFFDNNIADLRRYFPHSWLFEVVDVSRPETRKDVVFPDSITSWEFQAVSLSASKGFCVAEPLHVQVFKKLFVSLRLPYSVRRHEQLEIRAVIYNYSDRSAKLSVHMKGVEGLCSPGTSSVKSHEQVTVGNNSAQTVSFSVVPMVTGEIPITLVVFNPETEMTLDSIEKTLHVVTEGAEKREEKTYLVNLAAAKSGSIVIDGHRPDNTVPDSQTDLFVKVTGEIFNRDRARVLLTPEGISGLIRAPAGCAEQTMIRMSPVALAVRYLDSTLEWPNLRAGLRDTALEHISSGYARILTFKKADGSYGAWLHHPHSTWLTAFVVKVLSQLQDLRIVNEEHVSESVGFLLKQQSDSGAFPDPQPVIHREMQGGVGGVEGDVSLTAFITIALHQALPMLTEEERTQARSSITRATAFLSSRLPFLQRPYAQAITAFCLSLTQPGSADAQTAWEVLKSQSVQKDECFMWEAKDDQRLVGETKVSLVPPAQAITVETTAYGLLTALENNDMEFAESVACWLSQQENYGGGFRSTQDTILALEALTRYDLSRGRPPPPKVEMEFTVPGRAETEKVSIFKKGECVEEDLKRLVGNEIRVRANGEGLAKLQVVKVYHTLDTEQSCQRLALKVQVEGKVTYTEEVLEDYSAYEDYGPAAKPEGEARRRKKREEPLSEIEWFDARTRRRRDTGQSDKPPAAFTYTVCISHDPSMNLSGMAIVDITLLSGFEVDTEDLDKLKDLSDQYISHYETTQGRVLLYFDEVPVLEDCVQFGARQTVPIGLVQPASATFYDYYEPGRRCTVFYSAPRRSAMVSTLCSGEVCQCAEKPCYKERKSYDTEVSKKTRVDHACYFPTVQYGYTVEVVNVSQVSNFEKYQATVISVLRANSDEGVAPGAIRTFAKRNQCKGELKAGKKYLIMGNDGLTTDTRGHLQYLLDSVSWVEELPDFGSKCDAKRYRRYCDEMKGFLADYQIDGCKQ